MQFHQLPLDFPLLLTIMHTFLYQKRCYLCYLRVLEFLTVEVNQRHITHLVSNKMRHLIQTGLFALHLVGHHHHLTAFVHNLIPHVRVITQVASLIQAVYNLLASDCILPPFPETVSVKHIWTFVLFQPEMTSLVVFQLMVTCLILHTNFEVLATFLHRLLLEAGHSLFIGVQLCGGEDDQPQQILYHYLFIIIPANHQAF